MTISLIFYLVILIKQFSVKNRFINNEPNLYNLPREGNKNSSNIIEINEDGIIRSFLLNKINMNNNTLILNESNLNYVINLLNDNITIDELLNDLWDIIVNHIILSGKYNSLFEPFSQLLQEIESGTQKEVIKQIIDIIINNNNSSKEFLELVSQINDNETLHNKTINVLDYLKVKYNDKILLISILNLLYNDTKLIIKFLEDLNKGEEKEIIRRNKILKEIAEDYLNITLLVIKIPELFKDNKNLLENIFDFVLKVIKINKQ